MRKIILFSFIFTAIFGAILFTPNSASASEVIQGLENVVPTGGDESPNLKKITSFPKLAGQVLGVILSMVGVLFFGLMLYGGILWMTARGNEQQTDKALSTIKSAIIGLIIVLSSYILVEFVINAVGTNPASSPSEEYGTCRQDAPCTTDANCGGSGRGACFIIGGGECICQPGAGAECVSGATCTDHAECGGGTGVGACKIEGTCNCGV